MQKTMNLFASTRNTRQVSFKEALLSGELAGMVNESVRGEEISSPETLYNILKPLMAQHPTTEKFYCLFLNAKNEILSIDILFSGTISGCSVYPREIIKACLDKGAAALIVAHNHPSGDINPSKCDKEITKKIMAACYVMGIQFHEHVICGAGAFCSMAAKGMVPQLKTEIKDLLS
ncbi:JAB domain-containing protein [Desulfospira joergensenii]|uniref:JAB domain-containing protein n=1 Tax=Desulfospira joergensenii TaxID=53329 RepID=UPI0003B7AF86|nr:JAB domain-containing protein [Desulfospira joergensenii]